MLSRTAERLYWFARYMERTENTARLMLVRHQLVLDLPAHIQPNWTLLIDMMGAREHFDKEEIEQDEKSIIAFIFSDKTNSSSIISSINGARENIRTTREVMPSETWERVNSLHLSVVRRSDKDLPRSQRHKVLNDIIFACQQIDGLLSSTMNHDEGYHFIQLGRNIERADMSTRIVDAGSASLKGSEAEGEPFRNIMWISILRSLSAYQMYRLSVRRNIRAKSVLQFLLKSEIFPRATAHNLQALAQCVQKLSNHGHALDSIHEVINTLAEADLTKMRDEALHEFIDELQLLIGNIHNSIGKTWLNAQYAIAEKQIKTESQNASQSQSQDGQASASS